MPGVANKLIGGGANGYSGTGMVGGSARSRERFTLRNGESYPTGLRVANAIEITYVAGYGASSDVPTDIKQACLTYLAYMFEHRGDLMDGKNVGLPTLATQLLQPYVVRQFSTNPYRGTAHYGGMV